MKRAMLLMSLVLAGHWSAAVAATPVFQLHAHEISAQRLPAIDAYPSNIARNSSYKAMQTAFVSATPVAFTTMEELQDAWPDIHAVTVNFSPNADGGHLSDEMVSNANVQDDSLFHFLKNFKARPLQKPERGTMLLVGLCFLLYQVRRRPMRMSINFYPVAKLIGQHGA